MNDGDQNLAYDNQR